MKLLKKFGLINVHDQIIDFGKQLPTKVMEVVEVHMTVQRAAQLLLKEDEWVSDWVESLVSSLVRKCGSVQTMLEPVWRVVAPACSKLLEFDLSPDIPGRVHMVLGKWATHTVLQYAQAIEHYKRSLAIKMLTVGEDDTAAVELALGQAYKALSQYTPAIEHYKRSLAIFMRTVGEDSTAVVECSLGQAYHAQSQYALAIVHYKRSLAIEMRTVGEDGTAAVELALGQAYFAQSKYVLAIEHYKQSLAN